MCNACRSNPHAVLARIRADVSDVMRNADADRMSAPLTEALGRLRADAASAFLSFGGEPGEAFAAVSERLHGTIGRVDALLSDDAPGSGMAPSQAARLRAALRRLDDVFLHVRSLAREAPLQASGGA